MIYISKIHGNHRWKSVIFRNAAGRQLATLQKISLSVLLVHFTKAIRLLVLFYKQGLSYSSARLQNHLEKNV